MLIPKFRGEIDRSRSKVWPIVYDSDLVKFHAWFDKFKEGTHVFITIEKITKNKMRSVEQNSYYWGVVIKILAEEIGYSKDEMHDALKRKFLTYENVRGLPVTLSTTQLKTIEFEAYLEQIRRWASMDMGIIIPDPDKVKKGS